MNQHNTTTTGYLRSLAVGVLLLVSSVPALALVIESRLCDSRQCRGQFSYTTAPPANQTIGGGDLASVFNAAARIWESLIHDNAHFIITFGWVNNLGAAGQAVPASISPIVRNEIAFANNLLWFADATPLLNEEFTGFEETFADLGGGVINTRRGFNQALHNVPNPAFLLDLLTIALHEIGHILGLSIFDTGGDSFIDSGPFAGTTFCSGGQTCGAHLDIAGALMFPSTSFERTLISGADLLFVTEGGRFTDVDYSIVAPVSVPAAGTLWLCLLGLPLLTLARRSRTT